MATPKDCASRLKISMNKLGDLSREILEEFPSEFTEEQITKLGNALARAGNLLNPDNSSLTISESQSLAPDSHTGNVIKIVGVQNIQKNLLLYLQQAKKQLELDKFKSDTLVFQVEQKYYDELGRYAQEQQLESMGRMTRNTNAWQSSSLDAIDKSGEVLDDDLTKELSDYMAYFGV